MRAILLLVAVIGSIAVCAGKLDIAFIVDGSDTICDGPEVPEPCPVWKSILKFIHHIVDGWEIGPSDTKVAFATFGDEANLLWNLDGFPDKDELESEIDNVEFPGGELKKQGLVKLIVAEIFTEVGGDRPDVPDAAVLCTDGAPYIDPVSAAAASTALQAKNITVFVVCIAPGCDEGFAQSLASPPKENNKTYFLVKNHDSIFEILKDLLEQLNAIKKRR